MNPVQEGGEFRGRGLLERDFYSSMSSLLLDLTLEEHKSRYSQLVIALRNIAHPFLSSFPDKAK